MHLTVYRHHRRNCSLISSNNRDLMLCLKPFLRMKTSPVALASHIKRLYRRPRLLLNRSGSRKKELS